MLLSKKATKKMLTIVELSVRLVLNKYFSDPKAYCTSYGLRAIGLGWKRPGLPCLRRGYVDIIL